MYCNIYKRTTSCETKTEVFRVCFRLAGCLFFIYISNLFITKICNLQFDQVFNAYSERSKMFSMLKDNFFWLCSVGWARKGRGWAFAPVPQEVASSALATLHLSLQRPHFTLAGTMNNLLPTRGGQRTVFFPFLPWFAALSKIAVPEYSIEKKRDIAGLWTMSRNLTMWLKFAVILRREDKPVHGHLEYSFQVKYGYKNIQGHSTPFLFFLFFTALFLLFC